MSLNLNNKNYKNHINLQEGERTFYDIGSLASDHKINIETGLFFGKKNSYKENQNIFISGMTHNENQIIKWELIKIT